MLTNFDDLERYEFIQYIIYCYMSFYVRYDCFTENEKKYLVETIKKLEEVYVLD